MRKNRRTRNTLTAALAGAMVTLAAAAAWACSPQAELVLMPGVAAPGSDIRIKATGMESGAIVDVFWNSLDDLKVAEAVANRDGEAVATLKVPSVEPQAYFVVAVSRSSTDRIGRAVLQVDPAAAPVGSPSSQTAAQAPGMKVSQGLGQDLWSGLQGAPQAANLSAANADPSRQDPVWAAVATLSATSALGLMALAAGTTLARRRRATTKTE